MELVRILGLLATIASFNSKRYSVIIPVKCIFCGNACGAGNHPDMLAKWAGCRYWLCLMRINFGATTFSITIEKSVTQHNDSGCMLQFVLTKRTNLFCYDHKLRVYYVYKITNTWMGKLTESLFIDVYVKVSVGITFCEFETSWGQRPLQCFNKICQLCSDFFSHLKFFSLSAKKLLLDFPLFTPLWMLQNF